MPDALPLDLLLGLSQQRGTGSEGVRIALYLAGYLWGYRKYRHLTDRVRALELSKRPPMSLSTPLYSQRDARWSSLFLGDSGLLVRDFGCTVTAVAQALTVAGWSVDPGELVRNLNQHGGFTTESHPLGAGLLIWGKVQELYPQFHFGESGYTFAVGRWGKYLHWVLEWSDPQSPHVADPFYGLDRAPSGWEAIPGYRTANIVGPPVSVPVMFQVQPTVPFLNARTGPEIIGANRSVPGNNIAKVYTDKDAIDCLYETVSNNPGDPGWYVSSLGLYLSIPYCKRI